MGNVQYGRAQGILESPVVGMSTDEAQNIWVATPSAIYVLKPGDAMFTRYSSRDGLHLQDNPVRYCDSWKGAGGECPIYGSADSRGIAEITGGASGEVFVGYWGIDETPDGNGGDLPPNQNDPNRHSGKIDWVKLNGDGTLTVRRFDLVSSADAHFWHDRTIQRLVYDHFYHPHELYAGTNHGVTRLLPDRWEDPFDGSDYWHTVTYKWMGDHLHPHSCYHALCPPPTSRDEGDQKMGEWRGLAFDAKGDIWVAGRWSAGKIVWVDDPYTWQIRGGAQAFDPAMGDGNPPVFDLSAYGEQEGDPVSLSAVSVAPDGRVWWASGPWYNGPMDKAFGVAVGDGPTKQNFTYYSPSQLGLNEQNVRDLIALPDGRIVLAGWTTGLSIYNPSTGQSVQLHAPKDLPSDQITRMELDTMVSPWVLHVATRGGAVSLRVLP